MGTEKHIQHAEKLNSARENESRPIQKPAPVKSKPADSPSTILWVLAFAVAIGCDALDLIPIAGFFIALFFRPFLYIFLWKQKSKKSKVVSYILLTLGFVPVIDILPMDTASVLKAYLQKS